MSAVLVLLFCGIFFPSQVLSQKVIEPGQLTRVDPPAENSGTPKKQPVITPFTHVSVESPRLTNVQPLLEDVLMEYLTYVLLAFTLCLSTCYAVSAKTYKIYIDPGHYEGDDRTETEIETNLAVGLRLRSLLENDTDSGVTWAILMSRCNSHSREPYLNSPRKRAIDANEFGADLFLSIHCNGDGPDATGTETFWCGHCTERFELPIPEGAIKYNKENAEGSKNFANLVQRHMAQHGEWHSRHQGVGRLDHTYPYFQKRFWKYRGHLPILLYLKVPGCLNEIGFVSNSKDKAKLKSDCWRDRFAEAYRDAIYEYFDLELPISV
jgi:N-acetylmuramoyl-L-alanine amidase